MKLMQLKIKPAASKSLVMLLPCSGPHKVPTNREIIARYAGKPAR